MEELSYLLIKNFVACVLFVRFYFLHCRKYFSFSHRYYEIFMFFFQQNSSPLFFISPSSSFSVIHVSVDIENNLEKDSTWLMCFLSKSPGGHAFSRQKRLDLPVVSYLLIDHFTVILAFEWMWGEVDLVLIQTSFLFLWKLCLKNTS